MSLDNGGDYTVWAATAPFALNSGDKLTIDIETDNGVYRCEKSISGSGLNFSAGHIMSTNITLGNNATIVNNINIKVDIKSMPPEFPSDSESTITSGVYILSGYKFTFNSPSSYYYYSNSSGDDHRIRFNSGITKDDYAKITLPLIDGYKLSSVTLASISRNNTSRYYYFAITNSEGNFIDTLKKGKILSNGLYTYTITDYDPNNAPCYIQISHNSSNPGTADITYISLSYTKI